MKLFLKENILAHCCPSYPIYCYSFHLSGLDGYRDIFSVFIRSFLTFFYSVVISYTIINRRKFYQRLTSH